MKTWQEEKIKHTAEHIGIISEGALKTLVSEIRQQDMEALIKNIENLIQKERFAGAPYALSQVQELINSYYKQ